MTHVDGNAMAGALSNIFVHDVTTISARCASCSTVSTVGSGDVYTVETMGTVLRCGSCGAAWGSIVDTGERILLNLRGIAVLEFPRP